MKAWGYAQSDHHVHSKEPFLVQSLVTQGSVGCILESSVYIVHFIVSTLQFDLQFEAVWHSLESRLFKCKFSCKGRFPGVKKVRLNICTEITPKVQIHWLNTTTILVITHQIQ